MFKHILRVILSCVILTAMLSGCVTAIPEQRTLVTAGARTRNLQKLCKVWGFMKYTHKAFLMGDKDWDAELMALIPIVSYANEEDINALLYSWFTRLGDDGYSVEYDDDFDYEAFRDELLQMYAGNESLSEQYSLIAEYFSIWDEYDAESFQEFIRNLRFLNVGYYEINYRQTADLSWLQNEDYLGKDLSEALTKFRQISLNDNSRAPVRTTQTTGKLTFANEKAYPGADFSNYGYRLLGLFRLWNAMEYYFPYMDILDCDWNEELLKHIREMLEGSDKLSYELTLASLSSKLHDAHIMFLGSNSGYNMYLDDAFGMYFVPAGIVDINGSVVIKEIALNYEGSCPLLPGDVVLSLNGTPIDEIIEKMKKYVSYPNDEKLINCLNTDQTRLLRAHDELIEIGVLRNGDYVNLDVTGVIRNSGAPYFRYKSSPLRSHVLLDDNIGLINPNKVRQGDVHRIMREFADTDGIIIDLRQYPGGYIVYELAQYIVGGLQPFAAYSVHDLSAPGTFYDTIQRSGAIYSDDAFF